MKPCFCFSPVSGFNPLGQRRCLKCGGIILGSSASLPPIPRGPRRP